jgi:hypothetical protein
LRTSSPIRTCLRSTTTTNRSRSTTNTYRSHQNCRPRQWRVRCRWSAADQWTRSNGGRTGRKS